MGTSMRLMLMVAAAAALSITSMTAAMAAGSEPLELPQGAGHVTPIAHWQVRSTAQAQQGGAQVSTAGYSTRGWFDVGGHATLMAGLSADGGIVKLTGLGADEPIFYDENMRRVPGDGHGLFEVPWWYRTQFKARAAAPGGHTFVRINGIIPSADVWLNGHEIATRAEIRGAFPVHTLDVTRWLHPGVNTLALRVPPSNAERDLVMGWIDWNPPPPDHNMGPWRGVDVVQTGQVMLGVPAVTSDLALPGLQRAALTVRISVQNLAAQAVTARLQGTAAGVALERDVTLAPHATQTVVFSPRTDPALTIAHPRVWWPVPMGAHPLYDATFSVSVGDAVSDRTATTFGIRSVTSHLTPQGYRQFVINGQPLLIRGGGWSPDLFLRDDPERLAAEFDYVRNLGLNAIRTEGKLEDAHFYDLADRDGILILPGWECCDKWEAAAKTGGAPWDATDMQTARESMASEARLLRNHPSVIAFLIGSDNAPPPAVAKMYVDVLHAEHWPDPIVSAASAQATAAAGPSGVKMDGPYAWVPPAYWYGDKAGAAFGFDTEVSAGADIPRLSDLRRMLGPRALAALWQDPAARQYHAAAVWSPFAKLERFDTALAKRYGAPRSLADYVAKAQLDNYANTRAQFEAFNARMDAANPSTGVIYWMLNNAWPSLHWHLFDYYMNPAGAYFGAKKGNEPVHIQYGYDTRAIVLVNHTLTAQDGLRVAVRVRNLDGSVRYSKDITGIDLAGNHAQQVLVLPALAGLSPTYFVELELDGGNGRRISRNVYWLPTQTDVLDWAKTNWSTTPLTRFADLTALQSLPTASAQVHASTRRDGADAVTTVVVTTPRTSKAVALFEHLSIERPDGAGPVVPVRWSDNDVTLWPGESLTLTARYAAGTGAAPRVKLSGFNVPALTVPAAGTRSR